MCFYTQCDENMPTTLSPLRYPGGKTNLYPYIHNILAHNKLLSKTYAEPFAGGAGLAIKLLLKNDVSRIVIDDIDTAIFSFWKSILNYTNEFCELIQNTPLNIDEWHRQRDIYFNGDLSNFLSLGFATFYLNRTNISGIIKGGLIGGLRQNGANLIDARFHKQNLINKIQNIADYKDKIELHNYDAKEFIRILCLNERNDIFINFDPPYVKNGSALYKNSFCELDHVELSHFIKLCREKWVVTYDVCQLVANLYADFRYDLLNLRYTANVKKAASEYIFFSNNLDIPDDLCMPRINTY